MNEPNFIIDMGTRRTLVESLSSPQFKIGVEVGVRTGWFSKYILDHTQMKVYAVDPWEDNDELVDAEHVYDSCKKRLRSYKHRVKLIKGWSPQEAARFKDGEVDFVYIDALHDYESVKKDIEGWWPKIRPGGVISGHDFNRIKWPGVVKAVEEFCEKNRVPYFLTGFVGNADASRTGDSDEYDGDEQSWVVVKGVSRPFLVVKGTIKQEEA